LAAISLALTLAPPMILALWPALLDVKVLVPIWIVQVTGLLGLSNGAHEAVHGHLFSRSAVDRLAGRVLHGILVLDHDVHRRYHLTHHAHTGEPGDAEGAFDFDRLGSRRAYVARLVRWSLPPSPLHLLNWREALLALSGRPGRIGRIPAARAAGGLVVPLVVVVTLGWWAWSDPTTAIAVGWVPLCCLFPLATYITALPEHFGLAGRPPGSGTRNIHTLRPLQYLLWNINLHAVHHDAPQLHFSLLPEAARRSPAPVTEGYLRFHADVLAQIEEPVRAAPETLGARG
jgi:fatty acid desaturase